ncbi:MAG: sensor histidine kinase [Chloroflexota bacterium]
MIKFNVIRSTRSIGVLGCLLVLFIGMRVTTLYGQTPTDQVILTDLQGKYPLAQHLEILEDPSGLLTLSQITSPEYENQFVPSSESVPNFGFTQSAVWVRFRINNQTRHRSFWHLMVDDARIGLVDLYLPITNSGGFTKKQAGRWLPFSARDLPHPHYVFSMSFAPGTEKTIFMRFQSQSGLTIPLSLWSPEALSQHTHNELLTLGILYGTILLIIGYSISLFFSLQDRSYLYLALFSLSYLLFQASREGLAHEYLWPTWSSRYSVELFVLLSIFFAIQFAADFLRIKEEIPWLQPIIIFLSGFTGVTIALIPFTRWVNPIFNILALLTLAVLILAGCVSWWQGYKPARYYLLGWSALLLVTAARILGVFNYVSIGYIVNAKESLISFTFMVLLFSFALSDRIKLLQADREKAEKEALENESRLNQALEENRFKTQLLAKVSHELRTPLGAISGFAEMLNLELYGPLADDQKQATSAILDSSQFLTNLVNELLNQAQLDAGMLKLNQSVFSPRDLLAQIEASMAILAEVKGLKLLVEVNPNVPELVKGDQERIQQIVVNLISNAIKFTEQGNVKVKIYGSDDDHWYIAVSDTGPGIPDEIQAVIFEPFQQVDSSETRTHRGVGLGLSIVKQLVGLMQGQITLDSAIGQGSTFTICFKCSAQSL